MIKKLLPLILLILIGCSEQEPIDYEMLVKRDGLYYKKNTNEVYSGPVFNIEVYGHTSKGYIKKGKRHGKFEFYHSNGQIFTEYSYKDGLKDGIQKTYYRNGQLSGETTWKDNLPFNTISYFENGQVSPGPPPRINRQKNNSEPETKPEIDFRKIDLSGIKFKNDTPRNINTLNFRNETYYPLNSDEGYSGPVYSYYDNSRPNLYGGLKEEGTLKNGKPNGLWKKYYTSGQIKSKGTWKDGKRDGLFKGYYENGQLEGKVTYKNGEWDGTNKFYYENGQLESEGTWKDGKRDGLFKYYHENGELQETLTYKNGEIIDSWVNLNNLRKY